jgi:hypothetical protein
VREGLTLTTGLDLEVNIQLEVGAVADSVTVTAETPLLETRNSTAGQLIDNRTIEDVPLGDRRSLNVIRLLGGSVPVSVGREPQLSLAGGNAGGSADATPAPSPVLLRRLDARDIACRGSRVPQYTQRARRRLGGQARVEGRSEPVVPGL